MSTCTLKQVYNIAHMTSARLDRPALQIENKFQKEIRVLIKIKVLKLYTLTPLIYGFYCPSQVCNLFTLTSIERNQSSAVN